VLLGRLDKSRAYVLTYTGRRWETLGPVDELLDLDVTQLRATAGASDGVARTAEHADAPAPRVLLEQPRTSTST
jgi:hypothetical protein